MKVETVPELGTLSISRPKAYVDKLRAYHIIIDGQDVGAIKQGQARLFNVTPGSHELRVKIDWCSSNTLTFDGGEPDLDFEVHNSMRSLPMLLLMPYYAIFYRNSYLKLTRKDSE